MQSILKSGISGDIVIKRDDKVLKLTENRPDFLKSQFNFLCKIKNDTRFKENNITSPIIVNSWGKYKFNSKDYIGYQMHYIKDTGLFEFDFDNLFNFFKQNKINCPDFKSYKDYIINRIDKFINCDFRNTLLDYINDGYSTYNQYFNNNKSLCHGDFTDDNFILSNGNIVLIDTNFKNDLWQSFLLDISKFYQNKILIDYDNYNLDGEIEYLLVTHYIRALPYALDNDIVKYHKFLNIIKKIVLDD